MKLFNLFLAFMLCACGSRNYDWDTGAQKRNAFEVERQEEQAETVREQFPESRFRVPSNQPL